MTEKNVPAIIAETGRLLLRELVDDDLPGLCRVLQDSDVTYAYERVFSDREIGSWLKRQIQCYAQEGFGMWAVVLKETGKMIGHAGISMQVYGDEELPEIGYMFEKEFWHRGFATEAAIACRDYAFAVLGMDTVYSVIRADNGAIACGGKTKRHADYRNGLSQCNGQNGHALHVFDQKARDMNDLMSKSIKPFCKNDFLLDGTDLFQDDTGYYREQTADQCFVKTFEQGRINRIVPVMRYFCHCQNEKCHAK